MKKIVYATILLGSALSLVYGCASTTGKTAGAMVDDATIGRHDQVEDR